MSSPPPHPRKLLIAAIVIATFLVGVVLAALLMDWNALRGPVAQMLATRLNRPVRIEGTLDVKLLSLTPTLTVERIDIGNPKWAGTGSMARAERLTLQVKLLPLFKGELILPRVRVERPTLHLIRNEEGYVNWAQRRGEPRFGHAPKLPVIQRFEMQAGQITFTDVKRELEFKGIVSANEIGADKRQRPFRLTGNGTMNDQPFKFDIRGASLLYVKPDTAYPFDADITAGTTRVLAHGNLPKPFDFGIMDANFSMAGGDLADVYYLCGLVFPNTRPYKMAGKFIRRHEVVSFKGLAGTIGDSDMRGDVSVELSHKRPLVKASVSSQSLDLDDAATWFGGGRKHQSEPVKSDGRIFPDAQLKVARVRSTDAQVSFDAVEVRSAHLPIRALTLTLNMRDGVLNFDPVALTLPEGRIKGSVKLDATQDIARTEVDARLFGVKLEQFKAKNSTNAPFEGILRGRVQLTGVGNSVHQFVSASNGEVTFVIPRGEVRESLAELSSVNVARGLGLMLARDQDKTNIRCGVANLKATDGTLQVQSLVFDTQNVVVTGKGAISLEKETYDLVLQGSPKKLRLFRLKSPVAIRGPLLKPAMSVGAGSGAFEQAGVAAALAAVAGPLGAVVAFVDPGLAKDADCASLLADAKSSGAPVKTAEIRGAPKH